MWFDDHSANELRNDSSGAFIGKVQQGSPADGWRLFDWSQPAAVARWVQTFTDAVGSGYIDGAFVDGLQTDRQLEGGVLAGCTAAHKAAFVAGLAEAQASLGAALGPDRLVIANIGISGNPAAVRAGDNARMLETFACQGGFIKMLQDLAPLYVEVHAYDAHAWKANLVAFLLGAGEHAYWNLGSGEWLCDQGWDVWYDEYDWALGAPLGNATLTNGTLWRRAFASGTVVTLDVSSKHPRACIRWSNGNITSCPPPLGVKDPGCSGGWWDGNPPGCDDLPPSPPSPPSPPPSPPPAPAGYHCVEGKCVLPGGTLTKAECDSNCS